MSLTLEVYFTPFMHREISLIVHATEPLPLHEGKLQKLNQDCSSVPRQRQPISERTGPEILDFFPRRPARWTALGAFL